MSQHYTQARVVQKRREARRLCLHTHSICLAFLEYEFKQPEAACCLAVSSHALLHIYSASRPSLLAQKSNSVCSGLMQVFPQRQWNQEVFVEISEIDPRQFCFPDIFWHFCLPCQVWSLGRPAQQMMPQERALALQDTVGPLPLVVLVVCKCRHSRSRVNFCALLPERLLFASESSAKMMSSS